MKICKKCGASFKTRQLICGKIKNAANRKYCLSCSPWGKHNTVRLHETDRSTGPYKICSKCMLSLPRTSEHFHKAGESRFQSMCKKCNTKYVSERNRKLKLAMVEYKGSKCELCGYSKYVGALDFHHTDSSKKDFSLSQRKSKKLDRSLMSELDKCQLVCSNCHREIHHNKGLL